MEIYSISNLPKVPAVYAMFGGIGNRSYVAYVGIAGNLRGRINQHLVLRDSSIATGTSAVHLNPDYVTQVHFWTKPEFSDEQTIEAAELVAFDILNPALRSRGGITDRAKNLYNDAIFYDEMRHLFTSDPSGKLIFPTLQDALKRISELERRLALLENSK